MNHPVIANFITMHHSQPYICVETCSIYLSPSESIRKSINYGQLLNQNNNNISEIKPRPSSDNFVAVARKNSITHLT